MKITLLVLNNYTNDARVHKEATTLAGAGYTVTVIALWKEGLAQTEQHCGYRIIRLRLRSRSCKNRFLGPFIKYLEFIWEVWKHANQDPAHIYHANDANTISAAWLAAKRNHAKLVYDAHELETGRNFEGFKQWGFYRQLWALPEKILIQQAHAVFAATQTIATELSRLYHIPTPQALLNCPEKVDISPSDRLRQELNIPQEQKIALYQGGVMPGRGIETFLNAIQYVENTVGVVLGDGIALESLRQRAQNGEWQRVYFPGKASLTDLPSYTASADLGIALIQDTCLSYHFSLPNKLFEYLHAGLPVICSDLPEMARLVQEYQVGLTTDPNDPHAIAQSIQRALSDPEWYARAKANTQRVANDYNWQNESKKLLDIYAKL